MQFRFPLEAGFGGEEQLMLLLGEVDDYLPILITSDEEFAQHWPYQRQYVRQMGAPRDITSLQSLLALPRRIAQMQRIAYDMRPMPGDIYVMWTLVDKLFIAPYLLQYEAQIVFAHHAPLGRWLSHHPLRKRWQRLTEDQRVRVWTPSEYQANQVRKLAPNARIESIANPVREEFTQASRERGQHILHQNGYDPSNPVFLTVGRISSEKGLDLIPKLAQMSHGQQFLHVGEHHPLIQSLTDVSPQDIADVMAASTAVLMPSRIGETYGMVAAEAQAAGTPVLASNRGALPEVVQYGALIADDDPQVWYEALTEVDMLPSFVEYTPQTVPRWRGQFVQAFGG